LPFAPSAFNNSAGIPSFPCAFPFVTHSVLLQIHWKVSVVLWHHLLCLFLSVYPPPLAYLTNLQYIQILPVFIYYAKFVIQPYFRKANSGTLARVDLLCKIW